MKKKDKFKYKGQSGIKQTAPYGFNSCFTTKKNKAY